MVLTSPPYDNLRDYKGYTFDFEGIAKELYRIVKDGGVVVWVVGDATIKGSETGTSFKQALYFKEIGFNLHDTMIWEKQTFTAVGALKTRYAPVFEYMFIFSKGKLKTFNPIKDRKNTTAGEKIGRKGGILEKWKNDVLVESRERVASTSYLEKGRALMQMAAAKAAEVTNQQAIEKRYRDRDADVVIKKAVDMVSGKSEGSGLKPSKIKRKSDVSVFSKTDKNANKETIKTFQQRLIDLGKLPTGNLNGEFDEETKNASKLAMTYLGTLSGKVYADNEEAFNDFQRDLGFYTDNKEEIKKKMGL
jgi:hypothetical protein